MVKKPLQLTLAALFISAPFARAATPASEPATTPAVSQRSGPVTNEKDRLEMLLTKGMTAAEYMSRVQALGYAITARNDQARDHVEYEIVKGRHSYEVKIRLDELTGKARDVNVTSNLWQADGTEAALAHPGR